MKVGRCSQRQASEEELKQVQKSRGEKEMKKSATTEAMARRKSSYPLTKRAYSTVWGPWSAKLRYQAW